MNKTIYIGYVIDKITRQVKNVSVSNISRQNAGELMEDWLAENDPSQVSYQNGGVDTISEDSKYFNLK
jgi:hypothetical protein